MLHPYKQLPLTGAIQSMMPMYRRSDSFGHIEVPDEFGYYQKHDTDCLLYTSDAADEL